MTVYCYVCCEFCKGYERCKAKEGGCRDCDYWKYGECTNRKKR